MPEHQPPDNPLATTRESLHRVAEHVLSAALKRATGHIALRAGPGGVRTPALPDGRVIALQGTRIVVERDGAVVREAPVTTVRQAAAVAGVEAGFPWTKHPPGTPFTPDEPLLFDRAAAEQLARWFQLGDRACPCSPPRAPWPVGPRWPAPRSSPSTSTSRSAPTG